MPRHSARLSVGGRRGRWPTNWRTWSARDTTRPYNRLLIASFVTNVSPMATRPSGRRADELRAVEITRGFTRHAEGSVLVAMGATQVLCNVSVEEGVPPFLKGKGQGWLTAEYGMLPRATNTRMRREASEGRQSGRTQEIQRLIGRSLRAVMDLSTLGERTATASFSRSSRNSARSTALYTRWIFDEFGKQAATASEIATTRRACRWMNPACHLRSHGFGPSTSRTTQTTGIRSRRAAAAQARSTLVLRWSRSGFSRLSATRAR